MGGWRNGSIELLRDLLMLGICILHASSLTGYPDKWVCRLLNPCVTCFVFISGWYGITATPRRIFRFVFLAFTCVLPVGIVSWFAGYSGGDGWIAAANGVVSNWFVWAYVALMLFAPTLNAIEEMGNRLRLALPIIFFGLGWGWLQGTHLFHDILPTTPGLGPYSFTMMAGVYLAARLWRRYGLFSKVRTCVLLAAWILLTALCLAGFYQYNSPVSLLWSGVLFMLFSHVRLGGKVSSFAVFVAKSTFPVFAIHANPVGFGIMRRLAILLCGEHGWCPYAMYAIVGLAVFISGVALDFPRRAAVRLYGVYRGRGGLAM